MFRKGASDERWLSLYQKPIAFCQFNTGRYIYKQSRYGIFWINRTKKNGHEDAAQMADLFERLVWSGCGFCGKESPSLRCTSCKTVAYCNKDCQTQHWKAGYKQECKAPEILTRKLENYENMCGQCFKSQPKVACSRCQDSFYCNKECFQAAWPVHKSQCQKKKTKGD